MDNFKEYLFNLSRSLKSNRYKILLIFFIYLVAILSIGIINFPYIDDVGRQIHGYTCFAEHYCRWGSEVASWIFQGSHHLTDMGLTTHIITASILAISSMITVYVLNNKKFTWISSICSTLIGLNPWFLQCISFRFDSPYFALSILASVFPFLWWNEEENKKFFIASIFGIFAMCNTYQASSGIYIIMVLALIFKDLMSNHNFKDNYKKYFLSVISYIVAMGTYVIETKFNKELATRGDIIKTASLKDIPSTIPKNIKLYLKSIYSQSSRIWIILFVLIVLVFIIFYIFKSKTNRIKNTLCVFLYLALESIFSYGVFLIFSANLTAMSPRYYYGFGAFVAITLILLSGESNKFIKYLNLTKNILICTFTYYILSFNFTYASMLSYQKDAFERQSVILSADLKNIVNEQRKTIYMNRLFKDSPVLINSALNYPILHKLIDSNSLIYWPNTMLFNTYSGLNVNISSFDFSNFDASSKVLEISNYYSDIFTENDLIYIIMK